jgi:D-alanine--D-alanine ligase
MGEDGMIGAFLDTLDIPYMGSDYYTSAIAMDKAFSKFIVKSYGLLTSNFVEVLEIDWKENRSDVCSNVLKSLSFPLYIKPNHLGSSIGIRYIENEKDLEESIEYVFKFDTSLIIEERIVGGEVQAAVIGNDHIIVGEIGQFLSENKFFDYESKYEKSSMVAKLPLDLSRDKIQKIQDTAKMIYKILKLNGFSRVDFFLDNNGNLYFNEVNPIPGYSSNLSMFPRMLDFIGITNKNMINNFVIYALHRNRKNRRFEKAKV